MPAAPTPAIPQSYQNRLRELLARGQRVMLGLVGAPGSGKSTVAQALQLLFPEVSVVVPMDGYHLANVELPRAPQGRARHL